MSFAKDAIDNVGSFIKNKSMILGTAGLLLAGMVASAQTAPRGLKISPNKAKADTVVNPLKTLKISPTKDTSNTVHMKYMTSTKHKDSLVVDHGNFPFKRDKEVNDNGFWRMHAGAVYTAKDAMWNAGTRPTFGASVPLGLRKGKFFHRFAQLEVNVTPRNKSMGFSSSYSNRYGSGASSSVYIPNEVDLAVEFGPKIGIKGANSTYNKGVIFPYVGAGMAWGFGSDVNYLNVGNPMLVEGVDFQLGVISKAVKSDSKGNDVMTVPTCAVNLFFQARQEVMNTSSWQAQAQNNFFPPDNPHSGLHNSISVGLRFAFGRL